jgi:hypothetical protein
MTAVEIVQADLSGNATISDREQEAGGIVRPSCLITDRAYPAAEASRPGCC